MNISDYTLFDLYPQYSGNGRISGYSGAVDLNKAYITPEQWRAYAKGNAPTPQPQPQPQPTGKITAGRYRVTAGTLNVRNAPSLKGSKVAKYSKGEYINSIASDTTVADGYIWAHYKAKSGNVRYVAMGKADGSVGYLTKA